MEPELYERFTMYCIDCGQVWWIPRDKFGSKENALDWVTCPECDKIQALPDSAEKLLDALGKYDEAVRDLKAALKGFPGSYKFE